MYRKCATERSVQNQRRLENAFLELLGEMSYGEVTVTQICEEAGISRRIFYHLFGSKQDALYGLIDHRIMDMESYRTELSNQALRFFLYWQAQKPFLDALRRNEMRGLMLERMIGSILQEGYDVWQWLQAEEPENKKEILVFNLSGIMSLVFQWHDTGFQKTPEQMTALIGTLMNHPLAKSDL